jgi:hypothetical protein
VNSFTTQGFVAGRGTVGSALTVFDDPISGDDGARMTCAGAAVKASKKMAGAIRSRATEGNEIFSKSGILIRKQNWIRQNWTETEHSATFAAKHSMSPTPRDARKRLTA